MTEPFVTAHLTELEVKTGTDTRRWAQIRLSLDINAFGVNAWTANADEIVINEHEEDGANPHEELYFVTAGHALFTVGDDEIDAPAGTFVFVRDPGAKRKAVAKEADTTVLSVGAPRGKAFEPSNWERSAHVLRHWEDKNWEAAISELIELSRQYPDDATILYNLACAESLGGHTDEAFDHLGQAAAGDAKLAELAKEDSDFDPIRDDPRFASAIAGQAGAAGSSP